ncbi:MarR family transcriptional regulator [Paenibacillus mesophilus]|uniref:MarR family winged helix-turn-helix transcriptional regulator n=1 Tax=Paenibacillus mesophilus TaxID=2582849 RepID=UPI00110E999D|nr:MarR family transcriptional regulator [Paenibacillus mesophilus]TMV52855.1 MarR family transcriptional regulator [Paenibacillus mesophilus]
MNEELLKQIITRYENASFIVNRRLNALLRDLVPGELTLDQVFVLRYMCTHNPCTSSELADTFCVGKSSITAIISRLFDKSLIRRIPDEKDRRVTYLALTEEGMRVTGEMERKIHQLLTRYIARFDEQEGEAFIATFEKLARVLLEAEQDPQK